jgi:thiol-disulfide isomerase/thioredoxin
MLRISLWTAVLLATTLAFAADAAKPAPLIFTPYGTFEKVQEGWLCKAVGSSTPVLLREMKYGDILTAVDSASLADSSPIGMLQLLRTLEFDLAQTVDAKRGGASLRWGEQGTPQIFASQQSLKVLRSSVPGIEAGDVLEAIGQTAFTSMLAQVKNPLTSVVTIELRTGKSLKLVRNGLTREVVANSPAAIRLLLFDLNSGSMAPLSADLHGLNSANLQLRPGRWTLLHFWATWCAPCIEHVTDIRELSQRKDLDVLAIGFADSTEDLSAFAAKEPLIRVFAPSAELQRQLAIVSIPFDLLVNPNGAPVLVISGNMHSDQFKSRLLQFVVPEVVNPSAAP